MKICTRPLIFSSFPRGPSSTTVGRRRIGFCERSPNLLYASPGRKPCSPPIFLPRVFSPLCTILSMSGWQLDYVPDNFEVRGTSTNRPSCSPEPDRASRTFANVENRASREPAREPRTAILPVRRSLQNL